MKTAKNIFVIIAIIFCLITAGLLSASVLGTVTSQETKDLITKVGLISLIIAVFSLIISFLGNLGGKQK